MTSIATISNADSNHTEVFRLSPATHQRVQFVDLMPSKKVGILKSGKSSKMAVFLVFLCSLKFQVALGRANLTESKSNTDPSISVHSINSKPHPNHIERFNVTLASLLRLPFFNLMRG